MSKSLFSHLKKLYTVESVTSGHPDKVCDQISDAILDECLKQDPTSRVGIEAVGGHGLIVIVGEITSRADIDYEAIARRVYRDIGYDENSVRVVVNVVKQSPDIALGVDTGGAGDQGIMYGYATDETPEYLPRGVVFAHKLAQGLEKLRRSIASHLIKPDGKTQVTMRDGEVEKVLVSTQHTKDASQKELRQFLIEKLITPIVGPLSDDQILVNPTGNFESGGFEADTGLTGRKIMVDSYGGLIPHGGGCFSGKDPTKVDRSATYMCRYVAKNVVAKGLAKECLVSVAYAIGKAEPLMVEVFADGNHNLREYVEKNFDFRPRTIIEKLGLRSPVYFGTAAYGHFMNSSFPWERV